MLRDFGAFPVSVDVYPQGYEGPPREVAPFRNRSGWLMVSEARMSMPFCTWRRALVACVSDQGEIYQPKVAMRLLAMPTSLPKDAEDNPPEVLEELTDALYWDFLGAMDEENLFYLYEAEERSEKKLQDFKLRCGFVARKLASHQRRLRQERRQEGTCAERRDQIDAILARLETVESQFVAAMCKHMSAICAENDELREIIYSSLGNHGELEHLYTIRWTVRQNRRGMAIRLPLFQEEPFSAEAWRNRKELQMASVNLDQGLTALRFRREQE